MFSSCSFENKKTLLFRPGNNDVTGGVPVPTPLSILSNKLLKGICLSTKNLVNTSHDSHMTLTISI